MSASHSVGLAGQLDLLATIAYLGYNVAIPSPDEGDDAITLNPSSGDIQRIQDKTARPKRNARSHSYQFRLPDLQVTTPSTPTRLFAFMMRRGYVFHPVIISYDELKEYIYWHLWGTKNVKYWVLSLTFQDEDDRVTAGAKANKFDLTHNLRDFSYWPNLNVVPLANPANIYTESW